MSRVVMSIGMLIPRILALALFLSGWFEGVFAGRLWPILGIIFLPTTLMWCGIVYHWFGGHWNIVTIGGCAIAVLVDLGPAAAQKKTRVARI